MAPRRTRGTGSVYRRGRLYWIAYRVNGEPRYEPAKTASKETAERLLRTRLAGLDRGDVPATDRATWDQLAELHRADYRANGRRSLARLDLSLAHLATAFGGQRAATITPERLTAYVARRLEEGAARASVNRELAALRRAFRLGRRAGVVLLVPDVVQLREANARAGFLERPAFSRLLRALPLDLRPLVTAAYLTGWRLTSELATRQWRHVDLTAGWMRLEPGETKSGEGRQFPLVPELRAALQAQQRATRALEKQAGKVIPWVFHRDGAPLFYRGARGLLPATYLRDAWLAACARAGVDSIRHDFRRTAARNLIRAGVPTTVVMAAVGWSSFAMLKRYAIVDEGALREAGAKLAKLR